MLALTGAQITALQSRMVKRRTFIWCEALDYDGVTPAYAGFWDDVGAVTIGPRTYYGSGNLIQVNTLSARSDMTIPSVQVVLSAIQTEAVSLIRGYMLAQRPIEIALGIYDLATDTILPPLIRRFIGKVDAVEVQTPEAGGTSSITLTCESTSRALTIRRTETRSPSSLAQRNPADEFYKFTSGQSEQAIYFGRARPGAAPAIPPPGMKPAEIAASGMALIFK
jgi:hypothetical protein